MNIGYIGVGNMGGALAKRLLLSHPLKVFDLSKESLGALVSAGAESVDSVAKLAESCDLIFICLPTSREVRVVMLGEEGIAANARRGTIVVDQTSGDPIITREIAEKVKQLGIEFIDAPVSGGVAGAAAGTIAIMVGASADQFAKVKPVVEAISPNIFHTGDVGTGHVAKLANNMLSACCRLASLEAMALATKNGMDPKTIVDVLLASSGSSQWLRLFGHATVEGRLNVNFTLGLSHKDVRGACQLGADSGVPMHFGNTVKDIYQMAINEMGKETQVNAVALFIDRLSGTQFVPAKNDAS